MIHSSPARTIYLMYLNIENPTTSSARVSAHFLFSPSFSTRRKLILRRKQEIIALVYYIYDWLLNEVMMRCILVTVSAFVDYPIHYINKNRIDSSLFSCAVCLFNIAMFMVLANYVTLFVMLEVMSKNFFTMVQGLICN